jgi:hypothetical protein
MEEQYKPVAQDDSPPSDGGEEHGLLTESPCTRQQPTARWPCMPTEKWVFALCVLLLLETATLIAVFARPPSRPLNTTHETKYTFNSDYMSLDDQYDSLWNETGNSGIINIPPWDGGIHHGGVTMLVETLQHLQRD